MTHLSEIRSSSLRLGHAGQESVVLRLGLCPLLGRRRRRHRPLLTRRVPYALRSAYFPSGSYPSSDGMRAPIAPPPDRLHTRGTAMSRSTLPSRRHLDAGRPDRHPLRLRRHAARRPLGHGAARRPRRRARRPARGRRPRHHPHRHQRRLRAARHQPADPRGAAPVPRIAAHRDQGRRDPRRSRAAGPRPASPDDLRRAVHENLETLGLEVLDLVNLRLGDAEGPQPGSLAEAVRDARRTPAAGPDPAPRCQQRDGASRSPRRRRSRRSCACRTCTTSPTATTTS